MSKNLYLYLFSVVIDLILFKVADNKEMHILDVFQFRPDWTTDTRGSTVVIMGKVVFPLFLVVNSPEPKAHKASF